MKILKILALTIGSLAFIPVSCTTLSAIGTHYLAAQDTRYVAKGDKLHALFTVAMTPSAHGDSFELVTLGELANRQKSGTAHSFLLPKTSDKFGNEVSYISYTVLENRGEEQIIETTHQTDDNKVWSRYLARKTEFTPISSRMFYMGYAFSSLPFGLAASIALFLLGRYLRKKLSVNKTSSKVC